MSLQLCLCCNRQMNHHHLVEYLQGYSCIVYNWENHKIQRDTYHIAFLCKLHGKHIVLMQHYKAFLEILHCCIDMVDNWDSHNTQQHICHTSHLRSLVGIHIDQNLQSTHLILSQQKNTHKLKKNLLIIQT